MVISSVRDADNPEWAKYPLYRGDGTSNVLQRETGEERSNGGKTANSEKSHGKGFANMSSLYLGKIGGVTGVYEIHALTKDLPFREFTSSEIADRTLFDEIQSERYKILATGKPIYCTAIHPDHEKRIETNPHDDREGTIHIVSINGKKKIECCLSVAVDTGTKDSGDIVGLPLENCWKRNGYPEGARLDLFRKRYIRFYYGKDRDLQPWEMAELYRHFRATGAGRDIAARIGLYTGLGQLIVREAIKKVRTPTWLWVFDAIPSYFNLYRWVGAAVLRDLAIADLPQLISPAVGALKTKIVSGQKILTYKGQNVSRLVKTLIPEKKEGKVDFPIHDIPFLDGLIDYYKLDVGAIGNSPTLLRTIKHKGFDWSDRSKLRIGLAIAGKRSYDMFQKNHLLSKIINKWILKKYCPTGWEFNHIGDCKGFGTKNYDYRI